MYKRVILIGYKLGSKSLRSLAQAMKERVTQKVLRVSKDSTKYKHKATDYVINWGVSRYKPTHTVAHVQNKLYFFRTIQKHNDTHVDYKDFQINIPEWTDKKEVANDWYKNYETVVARSLLNSHSGKGISLHNGENSGLNPYFIPLPDVPLYVKYKKKKSEFRVHVFSKEDGPLEVIDVTQKKKRKDFEGEVNTKIRNHQNGWVYCRKDITEPDDLRTQALRAATAVGIKHGAVDVIYNQHENKCYVLEINSAPGIEGTTLEKYVDAFVKDMAE